MKKESMIILNREQFEETLLATVKPLIDDLKKNYQPNSPEDLLTRKELAELLGVDPSTIHNYTKKGLIQPWGLPDSGRIYCKRSEVEATMVRLKN